MKIKERRTQDSCFWPLNPDFQGRMAREAPDFGRAQRVAERCERIAQEPVALKNGQMTIRP
jgi:hypothetical protein